jgi:predicted transcriptional regulator
VNVRSKKVADIHSSVRGRVLRIELESNGGNSEQILKALASSTRLKILELLSDQVLNISEIGQALALPTSTANLHINVLEQAGLLNTELRPATRGLQKVCARAYDVMILELARGDVAQDRSIEVSMPIGAFVDCQVKPTCGLAGRDGIIGLFDDPTSFFEPERFGAQLIWFHHGYVEYRFPNRLPPLAVLESLSISLELCSEAPLHHEDWPSDITMWLNGVEIGTWTSPSDFGGQQGLLTPEWWETWNSQYGLLKLWTVSDNGSFVDGRRISDVTLSAINLSEQASISVRIGVKAEARHVGGINIFGREFGNYPQDIVLRLRYR